MSLIDKINNLSKKTKIYIAAVALVAVAAVVTVIVLSGNKYTATTMRLLRVEGTVNIENSAGEIKPVMNNIRFQSGDALSTGYNGLASIGLDETKIVTLESNSRVEFTKSAKQLELNLTDGALFFEVTEKLKEDETFEIKTSNMTVGIRGTSGHVTSVSGKTTKITLTSGTVQIVGNNPASDSNKAAEVTLNAGQQAIITNTEVDGQTKTDITVSKCSVDELSDFVVQCITRDERLLNEVVSSAGYDETELLARRNGDTSTVIDPGNQAEPTLTATPTPTAAPEDDGNVTTPTATPTITPPLTATPTATSAPTITPKPAATTKPETTAKPTATATPAATATPTAAPTAEPTATAAPTVTSTPTVTVTPTATATPTAEPTGSSTPTVPDGCSKEIWGATSEDFGTVYIVKNPNNGYLGWYNGDWVSLTFDSQEDGLTLYERYYLPNDEMYFELVSEGLEPPVSQVSGQG